MSEVCSQAKTRYSLKRLHALHGLNYCNFHVIVSEFIVKFVILLEFISESSFDSIMEFFDKYELLQ